MKPDKNKMTRRNFLKTSTQVTAMAGLSVATQAYGASNDRIRVGLVGCGGRGTGAARDAMMAGANVELVAMGDIFRTKVENSLARLSKLKNSNKAVQNNLKVKRSNCFAGLELIYSTYHILKLCKTELRHNLSHFLCNKIHKSLNIFRLSRKTFPQFLVLGTNSKRTGSFMTFA